MCKIDLEETCINISNNYTPTFYLHGIWSEMKAWMLKRVS